MRIRRWYQTHVTEYALRKDSYGEQARRSQDYILNLPPPESASSEHVADLFKRVTSGNLEWAYHKTDEDDIKMAAYGGAE